MAPVVNKSIFTAEGFNARVGFTEDSSNRVTKWLVLEEGKYFKNTPKAVAALVARTVATVFSAIAYVFQGIASGLQKVFCCCAKKQVSTPKETPEKGENPAETAKPMIPEAGNGTALAMQEATDEAQSEEPAQVKSESPNPDEQTTPRSAGDFVNVNNEPAA